MDKYIKNRELKNYQREELFDIVYNLTIGQYDLEKIEGTAKMLSTIIKDEVWNKEGVCYPHMKKINELVSSIKKIEDKSYVNKLNSYPDENLTYYLKDAFEEYCEALCNVIFFHGLKFGCFSKKLLEDLI